MIRESFKNLNKVEWLMLAVMIFIGGYYAITDSSNPGWYIVTNYISSIAGVFTVFLCAHASRPTWYFAIVNTLLYSVVLAYNHVYGTLALELLYYMPTNFLGIIYWKKHKDNLSVDKCKTRKLSNLDRVLMIVIVAISTVIYHYILVKVGGATAWLDAMIVAIGIIATIYEIKRFADQYYLWIITDVVAVIQWSIIADPIMITKKTIYLIMAAIGLKNWIALQKSHNVENE